LALGIGGELALELFGVLDLGKYGKFGTLVRYRRGILTKVLRIVRIFGPLRGVIDPQIPYFWLIAIASQ
jgi:hypothetical protein